MLFIPTIYPANPAREQNMLIEFRVENHRSLRDEQVLTLAAAKRVGDPSDPRPRTVTGYEEKLLPAAVIYGANASGKSNVLSALGFMQEAVLLSHRKWEPDGGVPRSPFAWGEKRNEPSMFEVTFLVENVKYVYGFFVNDEAVEEEWLFAWPKHRKQVWFEREGTRFKFGEHLRGPNEVVKEVTRPNALFLSVAAQHQHTQLVPIFSWFGENNFATVGVRFYPLSTRIAVSLFPTDEDKAFAQLVLPLLKAADVGIVDIKNETTEKGGLIGPRVFCQHKPGDDNSWLDLKEESQGTITLFRIAAPVFDALKQGALLLIDELELSLHPLLGLALVRLFNNPESNPKSAQIVFTTHDTNLLGTTLGESPLRRDQIWFTEKDKEGATVLYPLTDYKPRKAENLERGYLLGRYGAIPFLGDMARIPE
jgi:predicted ATPase